MRLFALSLLLLAGTAQADTVGVLERAVQKAGRGASQRRISFPTRRGHLVLDAYNQSIGLQRLITARAFPLESDGKLAPHDRAELTSLLAREQVTRAGAIAGVRAALGARRAEQRRLASADAKIDGLLGRARAIRGRVKDERGLWSSNDGEVIFKRGTGGEDMLIVGKGFDQRVLFMQRGRDGAYHLEPDDRARIARLLLAK